MSAEVRPALAGASTEAIKSCCADLYSSDWTRLLVGESLHPGGTGLTDRLACLLQLTPEDRVLDVAAGIGTSALHLGRTVGCEVVGLDLSPANVTEATERAAAAGLAERCAFLTGDAERLGGPGENFDAVICECAFCTFPDKPAAAAEMVRLLRPGGRLGLSDLTRRGSVHPDLDSLLGWIACIADARPVEEYASYLHGAGLEIQLVESHDGALRDLVEAVRRRLGIARLLSAMGTLTLPGIDLDRGWGLARAAFGEVQAGRLGYAIVTAVKPVP